MKRFRGTEILDDPAIDDEARARSLADVARSNRWLGGSRAVRVSLSAVLNEIDDALELTLLDVGTGAGDLARVVTRCADQLGKRIEVVGIDLTSTLPRAARRSGAIRHGVGANAMRLPFRDRSFDIVLCSQLLHHFIDDDARQVIAELHRVARRALIVADLRRSWVAAVGFWLVSWPMRFHPITRHDGVVSVRRGFTTDELQRLIRVATSSDSLVRRHLGWRLTAVVSPEPPNTARIR
jgi:SAM-dependent methyltransferase